MLAAVTKDNRQKSPGLRLITETDSIRLSSILEHESQRDASAAALQAKLHHFVPVETKLAPRDLVTMNSVFRGVINGDGGPDSSKVLILTLTYPHAADSSDGCVSVLTPLGLDLLGAREGDVVGWPNDDERIGNMVIDEVIFQPEASGDWHL